MKSNHFKMRWLCLLFALFTLNIQAQITVDIKNKPLKEAIKTIERSSNYSFFYNVELEGLDKLVTVKTDNASLEETMKQLLKGTNITFQRKVDNVIAVITGEMVIFIVVAPGRMFVGTIKFVIAAQIAYVSNPVVGFYITQASRTVGAVLDVTFASGRYVVYILMIAMIRV